MFEILLDNIENDKLLTIKLPIVPRQGDWIMLVNQDDFTNGEELMSVQRVILDPTSTIIKVNVNSSD